MQLNDLSKLLASLLTKRGRRYLLGALSVFVLGVALGAIDSGAESDFSASVLRVPATDAANSPPQSLSVLPDFALVPDSDSRKDLFFDYLDDYASAENLNIAETRQSLSVFARVLDSGYPLSVSEGRRLREIAKTYKLNPNARRFRGVDERLKGDAALVAALLLRVDVIPVSLVLAQAANESAWGTSRFAVEGNNLFGQWCYVEGCGFVPYQRDSEASHEVRRFDTIGAGVAAYFRNLNTHASYQHFRRMRASMRAQARSLDSIQLAYGLGSYSERGDNYIDELQTIIQQNRLHLRDEG